MSNPAISRFVTNLFSAFSKPPRRETASFYEERLARWDLTEDQWSHALSKIVADRDAFPTLSQIFPYLVHVKHGTASEVEPLFRTWRDRDGRTWAQRTGQMRSVFPDRQTLDEWKRDACSSAEGREIFWNSFREAAAEQQQKQDAYDLEHGRRRKGATESGMVAVAEIVPGEMKRIAAGLPTPRRVESADYDEMPEPPDDVPF